jgi:hypothetical protein
MLTPPSRPPQDPALDPALGGGFLTRQAALDRGISPARIDHLLRTGAWQRIHPSVYATGDRLTASATDPPWLTPALTAALLHAGPEAVVYGASAAACWGLQGLWERDRITELALPRGREQVQRPDYRLHTLTIDDADVIDLGGVLVTSPLRTVVDLALRLPRTRAVAIIDSALHQGLIQYDDQPAFTERTFRRRGALQARHCFTLAQVGAASPLETAIRLVLGDAHLPPDRLQVPIHDLHGRLLGYGDMGYDLRSRDPRRRAGWGIVEADGVEVHSAPTALFHDRRRANDFLTSGDAVIVRFTGADLKQPAAIVTTVRRMLEG